MKFSDIQRNKDLVIVPSQLPRIQTKVADQLGTTRTQSGTPTGLPSLKPGLELLRHFLRIGS